MLDEALEDLVRSEQVDAGDQTGDEDDDGALDELVLARPLDLLQLCPGLGHEVAGPREEPAALRLFLGARRLDSRAQLGASAGRALDGGLAFGLGRTKGPALGAGLTSHG